VSFHLIVSRYDTSLFTAPNNNAKNKQQKDKVTELNHRRHRRKSGSTAHNLHTEKPFVTMKKNRQSAVDNRQF